MRNMKFEDKAKGDYPITSGRSQASSGKFVLWREVVMAYIMPAIMAGIGGFVTSDPSLQIGALTTIGGASAFVALMLGLWLQSLGNLKRWIFGVHRLIAVITFAFIGASFGLFAAWATTSLLGTLGLSGQWAWLERIWFDFPVSATIASTLITWRWHTANTPQYSTKWRR